jgi:hypothetical protein
MDSHLVVVSQIIEDYGFEMKDIDHPHLGFRTITLRKECRCQLVRSIDLKVDNSSYPEITFLFVFNGESAIKARLNPRTMPSTELFIFKCRKPIGL